MAASTSAVLLRILLLSFIRGIEAYALETAIRFLSPMSILISYFQFFQLSRHALQQSVHQIPALRQTKGSAPEQIALSSPP